MNDRSLSRQRDWLMMVRSGSLDRITLNLFHNLNDQEKFKSQKPPTGSEMFVDHRTQTTSRLSLTQRMKYSNLYLLQLYQRSVSKNVDQFVLLYQDYRLVFSSTPEANFEFNGILMNGNHSQRIAIRKWRDLAPSQPYWIQPPKILRSVNMHTAVTTVHQTQYIGL